MNTWNDIYDYSDKIFRQVLEQIEEEKPVNEFSSPEILNGRLQEQLQYDSFSAYRKLKNTDGDIQCVGMVWQQELCCFWV